jgi:hypothetical protein
MVADIPQIESHLHFFVNVILTCYCDYQVFVLCHISQVFIFVLWSGHHDELPDTEYEIGLASRISKLAVFMYSMRSIRRTLRVNFEMEKYCNHTGILVVHFSILFNIL